jgi:hypothetical protein
MEVRYRQEYVFFFILSPFSVKLEQTLTSYLLSRPITNLTARPSFTYNFLFQQCSMWKRSLYSSCLLIMWYHQRWEMSNTFSTYYKPKGYYKLERNFIEGNNKLLTKRSSYKFILLFTIIVGVYVINWIFFSPVSVLKNKLSMRGFKCLFVGEISSMSL